MSITREDVASALGPVEDGGNVGLSWADESHISRTIRGLADERDTLKHTVEGYEEWATDVKHLTRTLAVELHGDGAAEQPSLCDLVGEVARLRAERDRFEAALARACLVGGTTYLCERAQKAEAERDAALAAAFRIKRLVWEEDKSQIPEHAISAHSGFFRYTIVCHFVGMNEVVYRLKGFWHTKGSGDYPTEDLAKKAAQDDHDARVRAAIKLDPALLPKMLAERTALMTALIWCSGSADFQVGGKARGGWESLCAPLLEQKGSL